MLSPVGDPLAEIKLLTAKQVCELLGVSAWTLRAWRQREGFPKPVFITDGSAARWRMAAIVRWLDSRERRRRKVIRRGRLKQGTTTPV